LCLPDGRVLPQPGPGARLTAVACASISARTGAGGEITVLPPLGAPGALQVPLALALEDPAGRRLAVAVALTPAETMLGVMQAAVLHDETTVLVSGTDGSPRAAWNSRTGHVTDPAALAAWSRLPGSEGGTASVRDRTFLVSSRAMHDADLRIHVASASRDALASYEARRAHLFVLCVLLTLCLAGAYRMLFRMHARSLARARALTLARAQLQALNEGLDNQVQERTAQLERAYHDLETFSYAVAHDVRAPLAAIAGFASALEPALAGSGNPKHLHYLQRIRANAAQMEELTTHLLELGRLTQAPLVHDDVDLSALANEVLARLREVDPHRQVDVRVEAGLRASGDRALLRQVLENLLGNAWKFSSRRSRAHIAFARAPGEAQGDENVFVVSDDGEGFDSKQATGLFRPFRRMHGSGEFPGSGVGLAAVQRIVVLHGGRVWCESRAGAGARFFFSLPR
jgi:signal transduction histidine kinase